MTLVLVYNATFAFIVELFTFHSIRYGGLTIDILASIVLPFSGGVLRLSILFATSVFHLANHFLFVIETFPWVMLSSCKPHKIKLHAH